MCGLTKNIRKSRGVTFIELVVAVVILAATISGVLSLFGATKRWIEVSQSRMTVGEIGKRVLDPLQMWVREDKWADPGNCLTGGACLPPSITIQNRQYNIAYTVTPGPLNLRRVRIDFNWNEPVF